MNGQRLAELYHNTSKHSNYQVLASRLQQLLGPNEFQINSRWEAERLAYITQHVDVTDKVVGDIGGNTGYFSFELIDQGAQEVFYFEGNDHHARFVSEAALQLGLSDRIHVTNEYFLFEKDSPSLESRVDVLLLLNVLHHVGDDYGDPAISVERGLENIAASLRNLAICSKQLVFQLGFNWKGDRHSCLFEHGTKSELIGFVEASVAGFWKIDRIGIPVRVGDKIVYQNQDSENIKRDDSLGEFLNRPLFILTREPSDQ
jgi:SAM-dependent methyltransferase